MRFRFALWGLLFGCLSAAAWAQSLVVIDLKHRTAQEIIPVLQPLLEPGGALSGQDYKLFVRTSNANLAQLRAAVEQIDRQQRQFLVSVRRATARDIERERVSASGTVRAGDARVAVNERPRRDSGVTVRAGNNTLRTQNESVASVQVLEGNAAFVATGSSVPVVTSVAAGGGRRPWVAGTTGYRNLEGGFMVTPRVSGEQVVLQIEQQDERVSGGAIQTQRLSTQVSGRVGEWIPLGGVSESGSTSASGILSRQQQTASDELSLWVKVEEGG